MNRPIQATPAVAALVCSMAACGTSTTFDSGDVEDPASGACPIGDANCYETGADRVGRAVTRGNVR